MIWVLLPYLRVIALPALLWTVLATAAPVRANDTLDRGEFASIPDIVITARKRPEAASEVPIAVSTVDGATLEGRRLDQLKDLNQLSPSLNISYFNPRGSYVSIRGIGHSPASDGLESSVGLFLDGVYLGRPGMAVYDLTDIAEIEVLRGPQGTLFGKNTSAGAILINSAAPGFTKEAKVEATIGTYDYAQLRGSLSGALLDDRVAGRLAFYHTGRAGWVTNDGTGARFNGTDRSGARLQFLIVPTDRLKLRLIGEYHVEADSCCALIAGSFGPANATYLSRVALAGGEAVLGTDGYVTTANATNNLVTHQGGLTAHLDYTAGAADITAITGYRFWRYRAGFDGDVSSADAYRSAAVPTHDWQFSQEIRIANPTTGRFDWLAGLYYFRQSLHSDLRLAFGGRAANFLGNTATPPASLLAFNGTVSSTTADLQSSSLAMFGQTTWHWSQALALTAGARLTREAKSGMIDRAANPAQSAYHQALSLSDFDPSGTLVLSYTPGTHWHFYASYARGTKAGGINPVAAAVPADLVVRPEATDSVELGGSATPGDGRLNLRAALFLTRIADYQATYNRIFGTILSNVGDVSTRGVEVEAHWSVSRALGLAVNGSYNDAHYIRYRNAPCPPEAAAGTGCDLSGRPLSDAPRWILNLSADYRHAITRDITLRTGADYSYRSHYYGNIDDGVSSVLGNVGILSMRVELAFARYGVRAQLWVKNVADTHFLESYPLGGATVYGAYLGTVGAPRAFGVTIERRL